VCGNDMKTGQTLIKTIIAPGLKARMIGVEGWYSTNILGNRDGEVLDDPESFKTKEESKKSVLDYIEIGNEVPRPFVWTKTADEIFDRLRSYCLRTSDSGH